MAQFSCFESIVNYPKRVPNQYLTKVTFSVPVLGFSHFITSHTHTVPLFFFSGTASHIRPDSGQPLLSATIVITTTVRHHPRCHTTTPLSPSSPSSHLIAATFTTSSPPLPPPPPPQYSHHHHLHQPPPQRLPSPHHQHHPHIDHVIITPSPSTPPPATRHHNHHTISISNRHHNTTATQKPSPSLLILSLDGVSKSSAIFNLQQQDASPTLNFQPTLAPTAPTTDVDAEDNINNQAVNAQFDEDEFIKPFCTVTRRQLVTNPEMCMFALTMSKAEPKNIKEVMADHAWIIALQEELHQFDRPGVWELIDKPFGKNDKLTSGDKSLDLSAFKLSRLFFSLLSSGALVVGDRMGFSESIVTTH
nr:integrase, catalytic region, zinc finger, CCHC-type, peptidase aspartic, catalytic [Tanacetum cinerariifolium]